MRRRSELEFIESFINSAYSNYGNLLRVSLDKPYNPNNPELGYSYRYRDTGSDGKQLTVYNVVCAKIGIPRTDYRVMMHEYGHIYLAHLDGVYEELDQRICNVFRDYRGELIERINKECGIDFAEKLIERVIDDPVLNHSLHNIAMDMEVNSKVLSKDDVEEMELDITTTLPKFQEEKLAEIREKVQDEAIKKQIDDRLKKMENEAKIKLIVPERYHTSDGQPFPPELSYPEYLIMIIKNLDQFVKMLVDIKNGGSGDTSNVTAEDVKRALESTGKSGMQSLSDLMEQMGMSDGSGKDPANGQGQDGGSGSEMGAHDTSNSGGRWGTSEEKSGRQGIRDTSYMELEGGTHKDHRTDSRDEADYKRELGQITAGGGAGCGNGGGPGGQREVIQNLDPVDEAIDEVIMNFKNRVVKKEMRKDIMWNYNRGINRKVIAPSIKSKVTMSTEPKIVYLIDISGSMDTRLVDRILGTIAKKMKHIGRGLHYDIISWSTHLGEHIKDIDPKKGVPRISCGGGTSMAGGIKYFREHYDESAILILISDFEDYLEEWHNEEMKMPKYSMYGFNYGRSNYRQTQEFKYFKVKNFNNSCYDY